MHAKFQSQIGLVILRQLQTYEGEFCREHGLEIYRKAMRDTLIGGWWGIVSFVWNFVIIGENLSAKKKVSALESPR